MSDLPRNTVRVSLRVENLEDRLTPTLNTSIVTPLSYDSTRVLVTFANPATDANNIAELQSSTVAQSVDQLGFGIYRVNLKPTATVTSAASQLATLSGVQSAQPDYQIQVERTPNDPSFTSQWAYKNTGQNGGTAGADIRLPAAWNVTTGTGNTIVAIVDTGIDYRHPDLAPNLWQNPREIPGNGIDDDGNGFRDDMIGANFIDNNGDPIDTNSHGTHVAGIIGARGGNAVGVAGIDWNVRIMALKFIGPNGGFTSDAVRAMNYAVTNGAKIINNSWGGGGYDAATSAAIVRARNAGVIVVNAAGNSGSDNDQSAFYPANYITQSDNVITVAATDSQDQLSSYSNFGRNTVTLGAPGTDILSTLPNNRYGSYSGTSMATPMVSGSLALLWDQHPTWNYQQIIAKLKSSVDTLSSLKGKTITGGRLNVAKLLDAPTVSPPSPPIVPPPPIHGGQSGPRVTNSVFGGARSGQFDRVWVAFSESVNPATLTNATIAVNGPTGSIAISAVIPVAGKNNTQFTLMFSRNQTRSGAYTLAIGPNVRNSAGNAMDQNSNGILGETTDRYTTTATLNGTSKASIAAQSATPNVTLPALRTYTAFDLNGATEQVKVVVLEGRSDRIVKTVTPYTEEQPIKNPDVTPSILHKNIAHKVSHQPLSPSTILHSLQIKLLELGDSRRT